MISAMSATSASNTRWLSAVSGTPLCSNDRPAMAADGDILFYGCDVGAASALVGDLAIATGADIAASNDLTGAAARGGDWELEVRAGDVTAALVVDVALAASYGAVLSLGGTVVTFGTSANFISRGNNFSSSGNVIYRVSGSSSYQLKVDGAITGAYADPSHGNVYVGSLSLTKPRSTSASASSRTSSSSPAPAPPTTCRRARLAAPSRSRKVMQRPAAPACRSSPPSRPPLAISTR